MTTVCVALLEGRTDPRTVGLAGVPILGQLAERYASALFIRSTRERSGMVGNCRPDGLREYAARAATGLADWYRVMEVAMRPFTGRWDNRNLASASYEAHNAAVRDGAPANRLVEWSPKQGGPHRVGNRAQTPSEPFSHLNPTNDLQELAVLDCD